MDLTDFIHDDDEKLPVKGVFNLGAVDFRHDTAQDQPSLGAGTYRVEECGGIAASTALATPIAVDLDGDGSMAFLFGHLAAKADFSGDQSMVLRGCIADELNLLETVQVYCESSPVKAVTAANAAAILEMPVQVGSAAFAAATTAAVVFDIPMGDTEYKVQLELPSQPAAPSTTPWITGKLATGFTINFATNQTMTVLWQATRT